MTEQLAMIRVDRARVKPPDQLRKRAEVAGQKLAEFFDTPLSDRIQEYPKFDDRIWRQMKPLLFRLFHNKCAYCETPIIGNPGDVDMFRPKVGAIALNREKAPDHYWWLAYEWQNLYLSCRECNFNKGSKFPVKGKRGKLKAPLKELRAVEKVLLLDPCIDDPDKHLSFGDDGIVAPQSEVGGITIEVLNLNRESLVKARREEIKDSHERVMLMLEAKQFSDSALEKLLAPHHAYATARRQTIHRLIREITNDTGVFPLGKTTKKATANRKAKVLERVKKAAGFTSSKEQHSLEQTFIQEQKKKESSTGSKKSRDEFLFGKTQYITRISIANFTAIEELTLEFPPPQQGKKPWLVLLGENGMGKSSILKAVALALMGEEKRRSLKLKPKQFLRNGTSAGFVEVSLTGYTEPFRLDFSEGESEFKTNKTTLQTLFFCYGGTRLLPTGRRQRPKSQDRFARINNLFDPFLPLNRADKWLTVLDEERFGFSARAIKQLLTQDEQYLLVREPQVRPREVYLESKVLGTRSTLASSSDGYQSVIALAADLLEILLVHYDEVKDSEGIVLIDEIDVHLHPRWKVEIISLLREAFPRVQFVVTTHDPLCLLGALPGEVHVLRRQPETGKVMARQVDVPPGTTADQVLTGFWFGLRSTIDDDTLNLLDKHRGMLREGRSEGDSERRDLETSLRKRLGTFADTSIDRMAQGVAAELMQGDVSTLLQQDRQVVRQQIREKLLQVVKETNEGERSGS